MRRALLLNLQQCCVLIIRLSTKLSQGQCQGLGRAKRPRRRRRRRYASEVLSSSSHLNHVLIVFVVRVWRRLCGADECDVVALNSKTLSLGLQRYPAHLSVDAIDQRYVNNNFLILFFSADHFLRWRRRGVLWPWWCGLWQAPGTTVHRCGYKQH